ncbi:class E sortase [Streptacidiphilus fuscans]|uniref:class E sortase n=1 Tax=Streptacidiphilus fuscans TaxID=2789292 RepID=UPI002E2D4839|nr:class E sortase [Streptacidiphilus fuscans]
MTALRPEFGAQNEYGDEPGADPAVPAYDPADVESWALDESTLQLRVPPAAPAGSPTGGLGAGPGGRTGSRSGGRAARRRAEKRRKDGPGIIAVRVFGEMMITFGAVMILFVVYQLWWTNVRADDYAHAQESTLQQQWGGQSGSGTHPAYPSSFPFGTKFAIIYIPKLDVETPIAEGTDKQSILDNGMVGHYTGAQETAFPWDATGNFALAGHRNTHGEPFRYIPRLVPGDKIVVETAYDWYTYEVTSQLPQTSPDNVGVIAPVPPQSGFTKPGRYITLTTCTPEFTSTYRMAVWGRMIQDLPKSEGVKPAALNGG